MYKNETKEKTKTKQKRKRKKEKHLRYASFGEKLELQGKITIMQGYIKFDRKTKQKQKINKIRKSNSS